MKKSLVFLIVLCVFAGAAQAQDAKNAKPASDTLSAKAAKPGTDTGAAKTADPASITASLNKSLGLSVFTAK